MMWAKDSSARTQKGEGHKCPPHTPSETPPACHQTRVTHGASHRVGLSRCLCLPEAPVSHSVEWGSDMSDLFPRGGVRLKGDEKYCGYNVVHDKHEQAGVIPVTMSLANSDFPDSTRSHRLPSWFKRQEGPQRRGAFQGPSPIPNPMPDPVGILAKLLQDDGHQEPIGSPHQSLSQLAQLCRG